MGVIFSSGQTDIGCGGEGAAVEQGPAWVSVLPVKVRKSEMPSAVLDAKVRFCCTPLICAMHTNSASPGSDR